MTTSVLCERIPMHPDFLPLGGINNLRVELRYASVDNFMRRDVYSPLDCAWAHKDAVAGLRLAVTWLNQRAPELRLCVLDALRPQRVQEAMWAALEGTALTEYLASPELGSIHSFGMAIDATLVDADGHECDMGTPFDDMTRLSHPKLEAGFLESGALQVVHADNRQLLRDAMGCGGFNGIGTEWWHFDCGDRTVVRATYARVL